MKALFPSASIVGDCVVFNIGGNKYRLIARIRYATKKVFLLKPMTQNDSTEDRWKGECGCFEPPSSVQKTMPARRPTNGKRFMNAKTKFRLKGAGRGSYLRLVTAFPLASIKSDEQLQEAQRVMDQLLAVGPINGGEEIYLDAPSDLVAAYGDEHHAIDPASDAEMLRHLMDAKGVTQARLSRDTKVPKSTISGIIAGKKEFSRSLIRRFADDFGVDASVLAAGF